MKDMLFEQYLDFIEEIDSDIIIHVFCPGWPENVAPGLAEGW